MTEVDYEPEAIDVVVLDVVGLVCKRKLLTRNELSKLRDFETRRLASERILKLEDRDLERLFSDANIHNPRTKLSVLREALKCIYEFRKSGQKLYSSDFVVRSEDALIPDVASAR